MSRVAESFCNFRSSLAFCSVFGLFFYEWARRSWPHTPEAVLWEAWIREHGVCNDFPGNMNHQRSIGRLIGCLTSWAPGPGPGQAISIGAEQIQRDPDPNGNRLWEPDLTWCRTTCVSLCRSFLPLTLDACLRFVLWSFSSCCIFIFCHLMVEMIRCLFLCWLLLKRSGITRLDHFTLVFLLVSHWNHMTAITQAHGWLQLVSGLISGGLTVF